MPIQQDVPNGLLRGRGQLGCAEVRPGDISFNYQGPLGDLFWLEDLSKILNPFVG